LSEQARKVRKEAIPDLAEGLYYNKGLFDEALLYEALLYHGRGGPLLRGQGRGQSQRSALLLRDARGLQAGGRRRRIGGGLAEAGSRTSGTLSAKGAGCTRGQTRVGHRVLFRAWWVKKFLDDVGRDSGGWTEMSLGNLGDLGNLDLGQLQQYVPDLNFPADKEEVASTAQSNDAPQEVVDRIRNSGKDNFNSADEVLQAVQGKL
jgi:hypothetical protein